MQRMSQIDAIASLIIKIGRAQAKPLKDEILAGACSDIERYRYATGYVQGIDDFAAEILKELKAQLEEDEDE